MIDISIIYMFLAAIILLAAVSIWLNIRQWIGRRKFMKEVDSRVHGASVGRGLMAEQFAPFTDSFRQLGWNIQEFKFLGRPIDGIQFEEDEIIIVEFKTGDSNMSKKHRRIKTLVEEGKVRFQEIRF